MAKKVVIVDDLDGSSAADETVVYGIDGEFFEIDLSAGNADGLRELLRPYMEASRPIAAREAVKRAAAAANATSTTTAGASTAGTAKAAANDSQSFDPAVVRAWAQANGVEVGEKGRIPEQVVQQWRDAVTADGDTERGGAKNSGAGKEPDGASAKTSAEDLAPAGV